MITGAIVLFNNDREVLLGAIESFLKTNVTSRLYLIDNSPTDKLRNVKFDDKIIYIHNPSNPGFGASHNVAIKMAIVEGSRYHLVLNPDVYFDGSVLPTLSQFMENNYEVANVMPKVLYPDGRIQYLCKLLPTPYDWIGRRFNPIRNLVEKRNEKFELKFSGYNQVMDVPYLSGCFMFLRTESLQKVGLFDENIFMYGEETDLCRRLISGGFRTVFYPNVFIYHHFGKGSHKSWRLTKIGMQSAVYYFNKWGWFFDKERKVINKRVLKALGR